jgi:hypothetical protein
MPAFYHKAHARPPTCQRCSVSVARPSYKGLAALSSRPADILTGPARVTIILVMAKKQPFVLIYDLEVSEHLAAIDRKYHSLIRGAIEEQLRFEPETATRNRKPLERPIEMGARWELRLGPDNRFRVFYRVETEQHRVRILAIGVKERNRLFLAGEEVEL